jgi:hypothetical protein
MSSPDSSPPDEFAGAPAPEVKPTYGRVAIVQSNYIPWKGYFDLIAHVDRFVLFDSAKFSWGQWRNRNQIKTPQGLQWLTVPIRHRGAEQRIEETEIAKPKWAEKHWKTIVQNYRRAPHFDRYHDRFAELYEQVAQERQLSQVNYILLRAVMEMLEIHTPLTFSEEEELPENATARVVRLCQRENAVEYVSGPTARNYLDEVQLKRANIKLTYADYDGYPEYPQLYGPFEHAVTILDLLFNVGPDARRYMKDRV